MSVEAAGAGAAVETTTVLLGLGANLGDPPAQLGAAVDLLESVMSLDVVSDLYLTEPVGIRSQPDFSNLVVQGRTDLDIQRFFRATRAIEKELGRTEGVRYGPRLIDIDILSFGELVLSSEHLVIPHPWLHRRTFVLVPLAEIAAEWTHPVFGETADQMLRKISARTQVRRAGPLATHQPRSLDSLRGVRAGGD